ncbi:Type 1 glutamine amidotransferase-like domain-containing protein [uncultured Friedmanniella sp.]|uniref:Type 1 glutamine amidotransferase-like domain-containing protein n=1 Tax=uncultured Friedmanniella sp. TaxID=335381 RepID=UPI0035CAD7DD
MSADAPTILATSGGLVEGRRTRYALGPLTEYALDLTGVSGRAPRICFLATASGDNPAVLGWLHEAAQLRGLQSSHLASFPMPNVEDATAHLLEQDLVFVMGGSVAGLLAMWRLHGYDASLRTAWQAGVVLTGISAGSICWHVGGTTDSFGPDLRPVTDGLAFLPFSNGVHYDSEARRRPLFQSLVGRGVLPAGYATDDGVGVLYRGTEFVEAVSEEDGKAAYRVEAGPVEGGAGGGGAGGGAAVETRLETRRL